MSERRLQSLGLALALASGVPALAQDAAAPAAAPSPAAQAAALEQVGFEEAVQRALERSPSIGQAQQAIRRAQALLAQARAVFMPTLYAGVGTTVLDDERGFAGNVTQPQTQSAFNATLSFPVLAATRWATKRQAGDQVRIARISAEESRRQVSLTAAQSYLAVLAAQRQGEIARRNRETAKALEEYAEARLDAGKGSRLNHVRSTQELAAAEGAVQLTELAVRRAQEALGVAIFADAPVDVRGEPEMKHAAPPADEGWLAERPDVRLSSAQVQAAERVVRDSWTSWFPTAVAAFTPQYVTPPGFFEPSKTWRAVFQVQVPIFDGTLGATRRARIADRETARLRLDALKVQARSEVRFAQEAVLRNEQIVASGRLSAESAAEALRITEIAYRAGATSNIEVVQAQQTARNAELIAALAEDALRQARLDLLVALGQFPPQPNP